jgi:Glycosyl transferase family 2
MPLIIDFGSAGNGTYFTNKGWGAPEASFTWTSDNTAKLLLPVSPSNYGLRCEATILPYLGADSSIQQELLVSVDDSIIHRCMVSEQRWQEIQFAIPASLLGGRKHIEIAFELPMAASPYSRGESIDVRKLGLCFSRLSVSEAGENDATPPDQAARTFKAIAAPNVAAVCMAYNEPEWLPAWIAHYSAQVGMENCFVLDDGTSDGSTDGLGCNVLRLPRKPYNPASQSEFNSNFCSGLLQYYDYVLYTDVDEFVMPDPAVAKTLLEYCQLPLPPVTSMIGLNVIHIPDLESPIDFTRPLLPQRKYVQLSSSMCKATLIRRPVRWTPGSHAADAQTLFGDLYLFHGRWIDLPYGLQRLARTREMQWSWDKKGHSQSDDSELEKHHAKLASLPRIDEVEFGPDLDPILGYLKRVIMSRSELEFTTYRISLDIWGDALWRIPARFAEATQAPS